MMVCLFWTVFLLSNYMETHNSAQGYLTRFMMVATLLYAGHYVFFNRFEPLIPLSDTLYVFANLSVFPLYLYYIEKLTTCQTRPSLWWILLILPSLFVPSAVLLTYLQMNAEQMATFIDAYLYRNSMEDLTDVAYVQAIIHSVGKVIFGLQIVPIFIIGNRRILQFERRTEEQLARKVQPLRLMLLLFAVVSIFSFTANIVGRHHFTGSSMLLAIPSLAFSAFLYYLGYLGYRIGESFSSFQGEMIQSAEATPSTQETTPSKEEIMEETTFESLPLRQRIEYLMKVGQMYLQPNLKISDLTQRLGSNRNYIYEAVNKEMGMSFSEYVNRLRVAHSQQLMRQNPQMLLGEVAEKSGFSSSVSFYRAFKKYAGCTPKEWNPDSPSLTLE